MPRVVLGLVVLTLLPLLAGCSQGTAATPPPASPKAPEYIAVTPPGSVAPIPIRIPEGRKISAPPSVANSSKSTGIAQAVTTQDKAYPKGSSSSNSKGDRFGRDGNRDEFRMGRRQDRGDRRTDSGNSKTAASSETDRRGRSNSSTEHTGGDAMSDELPTENTRRSFTNFTSTSASGSTAVTFGSGGGDSRNYKKPTLPGNIPSWYAENDKDGDGQISMHEWSRDRMDEFMKHDRNGDGFITIEEAMRSVPQPAAATAAAAPGGTPASTTPPASATPATTTTTASAPATAAPVVMAAATPAPNANSQLSDEQVQRFAGFAMMADRNGDGFLDQSEIENSRTVRNLDWKKYDANKDNKLDKTEVTALLKAEGGNMMGGRGMMAMGGGGGGARMEFRGGGPGGGGGRMEFRGGGEMGGRGGDRGMGGRGGPGGGPWGGRDPNEMRKVMFDNMDKKKTGKIAKEDMPSFFQGRFAEWDTNKDNFLDFEEFKAGQDKMRTGGGGGPGGRGGRGFNQ